jgi:hypothetical protein
MMALQLISQGIGSDGYLLGAVPHLPDQPHERPVFGHIRLHLESEEVCNASVRKCSPAFYGDPTYDIRRQARAIGFGLNWSPRIV